METDFAPLSAQRLSGFAQVVRFGHIAHAWITLAIVVYLCVLMGDFVGSLFVDSLWQLVLLLLLVIGALYYASEVRKHRRYAAHGKTEMLDDFSAMHLDTHSAVTLPGRVRVLSIILLIGVVVGLGMTVILSIVFAIGLGQDFLFGNDEAGLFWIGGFLVYASTFTGVCSLIFIATTMGKRVLKPIEPALHL